MARLGGVSVRAAFGVLGDGGTAVIEMAEASGYRLVPAARRNPLVTNTYGTGELIALDTPRALKTEMMKEDGSLPSLEDVFVSLIEARDRAEQPQEEVLR